MKSLLIGLTAALVGIAVGVGLSLAVFFVSEAAFVAEPTTVLREPVRVDREGGDDPSPRDRKGTPTPSTTPDDDHGGRDDDDDRKDDSDNSGKGSDDDSSGKGSGSEDDSSGKGSGGSDDDSSGHGSGDDSSGSDDD